MIYKYSDYIKDINEGSKDNISRSALYWESALENKLNMEWSELKTERFSGVYLLSFKCGDDKYDYYSVVFEIVGGKDIFYLEKSEKFIEKFKTEFFKFPEIYYKNFKYYPKCLGDISYLKDSEKYNL